MYWTALLLPPLITTLILAQQTLPPDTEEPGPDDIIPPADMETLSTPFGIMGGVNLGLSGLFAILSCVYYTKYRSKGSDDKKKMRR